MAKRDENGFVISLEPNEVFVFGSNEAGFHGAGAALTARKKFGAQIGVGFGMTGQCFAIPTKDHHIETLPLISIAGYVKKFIEYARLNSHLKFIVTPIGCGLAGLSPKQIAPMFKDHPANCEMPDEWKNNL